MVMKQTYTGSVQRLPETRSKVGNEYRLFRRGERALIYGEGPNGQDLSFEVFQIRTYPPAIVFGKMYPEREVFTPSEAFGRWAWWCNTLEKALNYFVILERGQKPGHRSSKDGIRYEDQPSEGVEVNKR